METIEKFFIAAVVGLIMFAIYGVNLAIKEQAKRADLYQVCLDDKQPPYACYGLIYGGRR